jgi:glyoxylase-like metal-dependent hydrolase (beta-lactamase superfamily II)
VQLAPGVWRVATAPRDLVNTFVLRDEDGQVTLVDAGTKRAPKVVAAALEQIGVHVTDVTRIVVTHAHGDHVGGLGGLRGRTGATVAAHERDAAYLREGRGPVLDRTTLGGRLLRRSPGVTTPTPVEEELVDGQLLDVAGGLRVLHTPGHTPGHVSLLHEPSRLLITGDSIWNAFGRMSWPVRMLCTDAALTRRTAEVLGELDYDIVAFTHGPEIRTGAREAVRGFLAARRERDLARRSRRVTTEDA